MDLIFEEQVLNLLIELNSKLDSLNVLQSDFFTQILVWSHFIFSVVFPLVLLLSFGWWFFKQFISRW